MKNNVFSIFTSLVIITLRWKTSKTLSSVITSAWSRKRGLKIAFSALVKVYLVVFVSRVLNRDRKSFNMSKLSFRARALDASKPMPVYRSEEVPDLPDFAAINRAVPQMPTGMEKEEECEHHLQRAISAQQAFGHTGELVIPTPEVYTANEEDYENIYPGNYKMPRQLIHMQPFAMDQDIPDYDMDSEDEKWINQQARKMEITSIQFEEIMDRLEKSSGQQVVTLKEAKLLLKEDDDLIIAVYDYWLNKRLRLQHPLIPTVKTEKRDGSTNSNPYVAFRRRTEKMQTRKNRKNDEASYEKMLKLRRDLSRAVTLLEMVKRREKTKREHLHLTIEIFEKRHQAGDFSGQILAEVSAMKHARSNYILQSNNQTAGKLESNRVISKMKEGAPQKKRQYTKRQKKQDIQIPHAQPHLSLPPQLETLDFLSDALSSDDEALSPSSSPSDKEDENDPDGQFAFRRKKFTNYHAPLVCKVGNWPWCSPEEGGLGDKKFRYCLTSLSLPRPRCIGFARRRIGRGGRVLLDRAWTPLDDHWSDIDLTHPHSPPNGVVQPANEFLSEIKNEWLHFRPEISYPNECSDNLIDPDDENGTDYPSNYSNVLSSSGISSSISSCVSAPFSSDVFLNTGGENVDCVGSSRSTVYVRRPGDCDSNNTGGTGGGAGGSSSSTTEFNLESFQSHREELFEMQRKQLERLKSEEAALGLSNDASITTTTIIAASGQKLLNSQQRNLPRRGGGVGGDHSNSFNTTSRFTSLDSASAQFAVSAVLSPSDMSGILNSLVTSSTTTLNSSSSSPVAMIRSSSGLVSDGHSSITSCNNNSAKAVEMAAATSSAVVSAGGRTTMLLSNGPTVDSIASIPSKTLGLGQVLSKIREQELSHRIQPATSVPSTELLLNQGIDSLIEITLPDGSVTSGRVHLEPSSLGSLQLQSATSTSDASLPGLELQMTKIPVQQQGQQLKSLQQPSIESNNCNELVSSSHGDLSASKVKHEIVKTDCGYTMDVT